jgi:uncharacterized protein (DUF1501 family)
MTMISRRDLLRFGLGSLALPGLSGLSFAAPGAEPHKLLVLLHLRGGCDGLNLVSPASDPDFLAARASDLRVGDDGFALANAPVEFRLHAAAQGLSELYNAGHLAAVHAAGLPAGNRSHFVAIDMMESGIADTAALLRTDKGWLTRSGRGQGGGALSCISAAATPSGEFRGLGSALALPDLAGGVMPPGGPQVAAVLANLYGDGDSPVAEAGREALAALSAIDRRLPRDANGKVQSSSANYSAAGELARPLQVLTQLVKMEAGLTTATLDLGGWDTHENQPGRFRGQVAKLSAGLTALWDDLHPWRDRMVVVVMSEFGRRLRSNKSNGTDHGRGGVALVLGGGVKGGRVAGGWPGLAADQLDEHVDLAVVNDYRQIMTEVLTAADGRVPSPSVFPGFTPRSPLGLFG